MGLITRISRDAMDFYVNLHFHLASQALEAQLRGYDGWKFIKRDVLHHTEALEELRTLYDSRLQAMCAIYIYLRDGMKGGWHNASLQAARDLEMWTAPATRSRTPTITETEEEEALVCPKCGTNAIHGTNKANCPWKLASAKKAKAEAQKFIRNMAGNGSATPPAGGGADQNA